jgi:fluoride exporter
MTLMVGALLGSVGAAVRYGLSGVIQRSSPTTLPVGTAAVNLCGALAIGLVAGWGVDGSVATTAALGFLGGFTTFSTWMVESLYLGIAPRPTGRAVANIVGVAASGIALAALGYHLAN